VSSPPRAFSTYSMAQLCDHADFDVRREGPRRSEARLHRHDYFQVHLHVEGPASRSLRKNFNPKLST
jgi:hypothetical protein